MITRRNFLRTLQLFSAGAILPLTAEKLSAGTSPMKRKIGIQLWTFRDVVKNDLAGTLSAISKMGFSGIEPYGYDGKFFDVEPAEFRKLCTDLNLEIFSTHTGITAENAADYAQKATEAGLQHIILPSMMGRPHATIGDYHKVAEELNLIGEICRQHDIQFGYHNHDFEFQKIDDQVPYDILIQDTDNQLVSFQMDFYFVVKVGFDPVEYIRKYPGRFGTFHIKDVNRQGESCIVGNGLVDFKTILKFPGLTGNELLIYEQETYSEGTPEYCAEQSLRYLNSHFH